jgi:hypothetical protein
MLGWMAWTWPTALVFIGIFSAMGVLTVLSGHLCLSLSAGVSSHFGKCEIHVNSPKALANTKNLVMIRPTYRAKETNLEIDVNCHEKKEEK